MSPLRKLLLLFPVLLLLLTLHPASTQAAEFRSNQQDTLTQAVTTDLFSFSHDFTLKAPVDGEAFIASNTITLDTQPTRSEYLAGSQITVNAGSGYNLFAAGNEVILNGTFNHDVYVAAKTLTLESGTVIKGELWFAGSDATLQGTINGSVHGATTTVTSSAKIGGNLSGDFQSLNFNGGSIGGNLDYTAPNTAAGLQSVKVEGGISRTTPPGNGPEVVLSALMLVAASLLLGAFLVVRFPNRLLAFEEEFSTFYFRNLWQGLVFLVFTPIISLALLVVILGYKAALFLFALYFLLLVLAGILGSFIIGRYILNQLVPQSVNNLWWQLLVGILFEYLIRIVPILGPVMMFVFFVIVFLPALGALMHKALGKD